PHRARRRRARQGRQPAARAIHYNFSPSLALVGSRLIIASTQELTDELASGVTKSAPGETNSRETKPRETNAGEKGESVNTALKVDLAPLRVGLADNREHLVTRNMLDKGHDRAAAEQEIDTLLRIVELVRDFEMKLTTEDGQLKFTSRLGLVDK
ncbi:MAG TPA: hypothetical protein PLV92_29765, partial [Pirellulaceae bacterium]|nr:hypothetical protein [Pirellulaceae bacterium]